MSNIQPVITLDDFNTWIQIFANIGVLFSIAIGVWQYCKGKKLQQVQKAIEIAEDFQKIIPGISIILDSFEKSEVSSNIKSLNNENMLYFDKEELEKNIPEQVVKKIDELYSKLEKEGVSVDDKAPRVTVSIGSILNKLEVMAMYFNTNVANEKVVYQSLHQLYFAIIKVAYVKIARVNVNEKDKYYTNVIELFRKWSIEQKKAEKKTNKLKVETLRTKTKI